MNNILRPFVLLSFIIVTATMSLHGQRTPQYTQYMYNTLVLNPAYAGAKEALSAIAMYREQWFGVDGAPSTQNLAVHGLVSDRLGMGLTLVNDEIGNGTLAQTEFNLAFSYTIPTSELGRLGFGLQLGGNLLNIDFNQLRVFDPSLNPGLQTNIDNQFSPNFGLGAYYRHGGFYGGVSMPAVLRTEFFDVDDEEDGVSLAPFRSYFITGYVMQLSSDWMFKPAVLVQLEAGTPAQADISANFMFKEKFTIGAGYRIGASMAVLAGYQLTNNFMVGMAYDRELSPFASQVFNDGAVEFFVAYDFLNRFCKCTTQPRFY